MEELLEYFRAIKTDNRYITSVKKINGIETVVTYDTVKDKLILKR